MATLHRYIEKLVLSDLKEKMVFLGGPRQVGKTTFAQSLLFKYRAGHPAYLNWDSTEDKSIILKQAWPSLKIFAKFHKWKYSLMHCLNEWPHLFPKKI